MTKCLKVGVLTPIIYMIDLENSRIVMEYIKGITVKDYLNTLGIPNIYIYYIPKFN